ncbi:MAG: type II toxin-antitoxin system HicB family antitoxin [Holophagaceae bacterium]|nr:type II toxin-antitoxin system HicB family antitoxin [Holophagaceae bacterium]
MKLTYPACFFKDKETNTYTVELPDLPGCVSQGNTLDHAIQMGTEAASMWVLRELEIGKPAPNATPIEEIKPEQGWFTSFLLLDLDEYVAKNGQQPIKKTFEIPAYLNAFAESQGINYSHIIQKQITEMYYSQHS